MSNTKTIMGQASNQYVTPTDITDVFSTYLYDGSSSAQTITNGIDLAGEGGLVWMKNRTIGSYSHALQHTTIADGGYLSSNTTVAFQAAANNGISAFNSNGFTFDTGNWEEFNNSAHDYASWTFRKAPKFFDIVTWTGDSVAGREIAHGLGGAPGMMFVKNLTSATSWAVYHRHFGGNSHLFLDTTSAVGQNILYWNNTDATSTHFTVGTANRTNTSGQTYVAYIFAHNDGDGGFGPNYDQDIIKCGSYTGNGVANGPEINLGFEPQWLMIKRSDSADGWSMVDSMRGFDADGSVEQFSANNTDAGTARTDRVSPSATGFKLRATDFEWNASGGTYIYMAIRRGPLTPPEAGTEVFSVNTGTPGFTTGFATDFSIHTTRAGGYSHNAISRLTGLGYLRPDATDAEATANSTKWFNNGSANTLLDLSTNWFAGVSDVISWNWKRAPSYFDAVAYTGNSTAGLTVSHNLGVAPEMVWVKNRTTGGTFYDWAVYHKDLGNTKYLFLNTTDAAAANNEYWNDTSPTSSVFSLGGPSTRTNESGKNYIAYLFATLAGVSKVGSVSHVQYTDTNVDCGFTSGARFVLLKRTNTTGDWWVFDTTRGIAAGDDQILFLNSTAAEFANDSMSPLASGFTMVGAGNETGDYIFYAIA